MLQTRVSVSDSYTQVSSQTVESTEAFSKDLLNSRQQSTVKTVKFSMRMIKCQDKVCWIVKHIFLISPLCTVGHVVREWDVCIGVKYFCVCVEIYLNDIVVWARRWSNVTQLLSYFITLSPRSGKPSQQWYEITSSHINHIEILRTELILGVQGVH